VKSRILCVALLLSALPLARSGAAVQANISGAWTFSMHFPGGEDTHHFVFKQQGEKLTGTATGVLTKVKDITGTVKGDEVAFTVTGTNIREEPMTVDYTGKVVSKTKMTGKVDYHKGPLVDWEATKR